MNRTPCHALSAEQITALIGKLVKVEWVWSGQTEHLDIDGTGRVGIITEVDFQDEPGDSCLRIRSRAGHDYPLYFWGDGYTTLFFTTPEDQ